MVLDKKATIDQNCGEQLTVGCSSPADKSTYNTTPSLGLMGHGRRGGTKIAREPF